MAGPRRTYYQPKMERPPWSGSEPLIWSTEEERGALLNTADGKLTAVWAHEVATYLLLARANGDPADPAYDGEKGWKQARLSEESDPDKDTVPK